MAYHTFTKNGYRLIGMDHFALEDDELSLALDNDTIHRNFMGYSTRSDAHQLGFGVSSISYVGGNYFQNLKELPSYCEAISSKGLASFRGFILTEDDKIRRALITKIMCNGRVDFKTFESKWGICFRDYFEQELQGLDEFIQDNLLEVDEKGIRVIGYGHLFLRNIAMTFDTYLEGIREEATTPTFSKTV
jgi:oxygen-independent coproporphyrinogen-3 oxidase